MTIFTGDLKVSKVTKTKYEHISNFFLTIGTAPLTRKFLATALKF